METLIIDLTNPTGLHARPAKNFVNVVQQFSSNISVTYQDKQANGKSLISLLKLGAESGAQIRIEIEGEDEQTAFNTLQESLAAGLLEE